MPRRNRIAKIHPEFWRHHRKDARQLEQLLNEVPRLRKALFPSDDQDQRDFLDWYEPMFLREIEQPEDVS